MAAIFVSEKELYKVKFSVVYMPNGERGCYRPTVSYAGKWKVESISLEEVFIQRQCFIRWLTDYLIIWPCYWSSLRFESGLRQNSSNRKRFLTVYISSLSPSYLDWKMLKWRKTVKRSITSLSHRKRMDNNKEIWAKKFWTCTMHPFSDQHSVFDVMLICVFRKWGWYIKMHAFSLQS